MPAILRSLQRLLNLLEDKNIFYMIIDGYALPCYGRIRTTIDIDLAVAIKTEEELKQLLTWLQEIEFEAPISSIQNPLILLVDQKEKIEIELWLRPDGIVFDDETLKRRKRATLPENIEAWIVSAEDFIVNKLARPDRSVIDEQDVKSVLVMQNGKLDEEYLKRRAKNVGVLEVLKKIKALG